MDAARFVVLSRSIRAQAFMENVLDVGYSVTAHGNNNISPGSPRAIRVAIVTDF